jgi:Ca2+-binding RTX toxin-like protein
VATYNGTTGNNSYTGTPDGDSISGNAGNDTLLGADGIDTIYGGAGNDSLAGGDGNDLIYGDFDPSEDLIVNGSFTRTGGAFTIAGWNSINPTTSFGPFYSGSYVALNASAVATYGEGVQQTVATAVGQVYSASLRAFEDNTGTANHTLLIEVLDGAGNVIYTQTEVILNQTNRAINFSFTAVSPNSTIRLTNPTSTNTVQTDLKLDNVVILGPVDPIGADTIDAGAGNDLVYAGDGNDSLIGGAGSDSVYGGGGDDAFDFGDIGDDLHFGGAGNDVMSGGAGNDTLYGDEGIDTIEGGADNDLIYAGDGSDNLDGGAGNDTIYAGAGDDTWQIDDTGNDLQYGGAGNDILSGDLGNDTLYGDEGDDVLEGHEGQDFVFGGAGNDYVTGADISEISNLASRTLTPTVATDDGSNDYLDAGAGDDTVFGNGGRDTLIGGSGNDYLIGGTGADVFTVQGADTITDFDATTGILLNGNLDNDFVDLRGFYNASTLAAWNAANPGNQYDNALKWLQADQADGILQSAGGLRIQSGGVAVSAALLNDENTAVCFTAGTRLATAKGHRPIEKLRVGDLVQTADHGLQPIRWIGSMTVDGMGALAPILISAGALGNRRDIMVSPLHRMLVSGWKVELLFGEDEVIAAAKMLVDGADIRPHPMRAVTYYHLLFDAHEIVFAEGAGAESFHPGEEGFDALGACAQDEITALLPHIAGGNFAAYGPSARRSLRAHEARLLQMGRKMEDTGQMQTAPRTRAVAAR